MLSPPDIAVIGALALIFFGPDQLPKVARKAGQVMREVQNTSQTFIREMERAADDIDLKEAFVHEPEPTMTGPRPASEKFAEPSPSIAEQQSHQSAADAAKTGVTAPEPPAPNDVSHDASAHEDASGI